MSNVLSFDKAATGFRSVLEKQKAVDQFLDTVSTEVFLDKLVELPSGDFHTQLRKPGTTIVVAISVMRDEDK